ncbi:unnamed protein product [marine sediment metagenome]|uniref:Uncharacterized protein n=1 Tax=marine sediment metagenome TaxID=412755 RepID=X1K7S7_9ZZZZ
MYNIKAKAVGKNPKIRLITRSKYVNFTRSAAPSGKKRKTIKSVGHHAKKVSKSPFSFLLVGALFLTL